MLWERSSTNKFCGKAIQYPQRYWIAFLMRKSNIRTDIGNPPEGCSSICIYGKISSLVNGAFWGINVPYSQNLQIQERTGFEVTTAFKWPRSLNLRQFLSSIDSTYYVPLSFKWVVKLMINPEASFLVANAPVRFETHRFWPNYSVVDFCAFWNAHH